ncbi:hypothetical protein TSUD_367230 [Trifolium subterraneum]|uniref:Reverse transcriptase domain-containing protein n=1 Tax=Trifolium subterraneum TaxID=3900 RepID=A0A2Z6PIN6_TRISU|nr:hypothetical protein TSUD_367230 [Trifolium subterraneum]
MEVRYYSNDRYNARTRKSRGRGRSLIRRHERFGYDDREVRSLVPVNKHSLSLIAAQGRNVIVHDNGDNNGAARVNSQVTAIFYFTNFPKNLLFVDLKKGLEVCGILEDVYVSRYNNYRGQRFVRESGDVVEGVGCEGVDGKTIREKKIRRVACDVVVTESVRKREIDLVKEEEVTCEREKEGVPVVTVGEVECVVWKDIKQGFYFPEVQQSLLNSGMDELNIITLSGDKVLLYPRVKSRGEYLVDIATDIIGMFMSDFKPWSLEADSVYERGAWVRCYGVLVHAWNDIFFAELAETQGRLLKIDDVTSNKERMDYAHLLLAIPLVKEVNTTVQVLINNKMTNIKICEDLDHGYGTDACLVECGDDNRSLCSGHTHMHDEEPMVDALVHQLQEDWVKQMEVGSKPNRDDSEAVHYSSSSASVHITGAVDSSGKPILRQVPIMDDIQVPRDFNNSTMSKRRVPIPSVFGLKKIARLSATDRNVLIRSLKKTKRQQAAKKSSRRSSKQKLGTSLTAGSGSIGKGTCSADWHNWVALHANEKKVHDDIMDVGKVIGVKCSNSFQALTGGSGRVRESVVRKANDRCFINEEVVFDLANVYAPCEVQRRSVLWSDLDRKLHQDSNVAWCVLGDFNAIRSHEERVIASLVVALPRTLSDHCLIQLCIDDQNWGPKPLRMLKCWSDIPGYVDFVRDKWSSFPVRGWSGYILKTKLKFIKAELRSWHLQHTANIDSRIQKAKNRLADLDIIGEGRQLLGEEVEELHSLPADILSLSKLQASMQWQSNTIGSLIVEGRTVGRVPEVRDAVFHHFSHHFRKKLHHRFDISGLLFKTLTTEDSAGLVQPFLLDEIKEAVWDCDSFKCPGPDGINIGFLKDFWDFLKLDFLNFFSEFYHHGRLTKGLNSTFIALIPKVDCPQRVADFRPIALVSSVYKVLSKVLANRLRRVVGGVVSQTQSAFIKGRQILDGILIANEIVDDAKRDKKELLMLKIDFEKAYDSVEWDYLDEVLCKMSFPCKWRVWMKECVSTATTSVLVNGSPTDEFRFERGLRQGDPLSPFLFLLAAEGLNVMMSAMVSNNLFTPYGLGPQNVVQVSHLQFADDTLLVGVKNWANVRALKAVLVLFESVSGLKVNFHKSMLFGVNVADSWLHEAAVVMGCKHGRLPFMYLGLPIGGDERKLQFWYPLVDRIRKRLSGWKCKNLSFGGHLILLKSVLSSIPVYFLSFFKAPSGKWVWRCLEEEDRLWCRVLRAKYGQVGGKVRFREGVGSSWWQALNRVRMGAGLADTRWLLDNICRKVGDGRNTCFWLDPWSDDDPLQRSFSRLFDLSENKEAMVADMIVAGSGEGVPDRWVWQLHSSQSYSVKSAYSFLTASEIPLSDSSERFLWLKAVPLKKSTDFSVDFGFGGNNTGKG